MTWRIEWLPEALHDLRSLDGSERPVVIRAVREKLTRAPEDFGLPLRTDGSTPLPGARRLRVRSLRAIYFVFPNDGGAKVDVVLILAVGRRADNEVYTKASERVKSLRKSVQAEFQEVGALLRRFLAKEDGPKS